MAALVREGARAAGVQLQSYSVGRPLGRVMPEISVKTEEPEKFVADLSWRLPAIAGVLNGGGSEPARSEGAYVEVRERSGRLVVASAYSVRTGHGAAAIGSEYSHRHSGGWGRGPTLRE